MNETDILRKIATSQGRAYVTPEDVRAAVISTHGALQRVSSTTANWYDHQLGISQHGLLAELAMIAGKQAEPYLGQPVYLEDHGLCFFIAWAMENKP